MKNVFVPNYYNAFRCIAGACRHSCCVGWEIDVDEDTLRYYDALTGEMGARLRASIDREADPPCFRLNPDERCPFLNENGLCDIITELGEDSLCHICHDHPRFRNVLGDRVELGLGLCCEAASRLILSQTDPFSLVELPPEQAARERHAHEDPEELDGLSAILIDYRDATIPILTDRTVPFSDRIRHVFANLYVDLSESVTDALGDFASIASLLRDMERLDPEWDTYLNALEELTEDPLCELDGEDDVAYENLICYFLYRYMTTDSLMWPDTTLTRTVFAFYCTAIIHAIHRATGGKDFDSLCEIARMFSSEIEYSEENLERLMREAEDASF